MSAEPKHDPAGAEAILQWLSLAHGHDGTADADQLYRQLLLLRETPTPSVERVKLLDLLFAHVERLVLALFPDLQDISLPVSRRIRQRVRSIQDVLEAVTQEYFNSLAAQFDPAPSESAPPAGNSLQRAMQAIAWHIRISHLVAAPTGIGQWQQLHAAYQDACKLGLISDGSDTGRDLQTIYLCVLLTAIAQPASFSSRELEFINEFTCRNVAQVSLQEEPPESRDGVFWIDLDKDFPAHALIRRIPSPDSATLYFSCQSLAEHTGQLLAALEKGEAVAELNLPAFAATQAGRGVLQRLQRLWGEPARRRFTRRRQSYRAHLCSGLDDLWHALRDSGETRKVSEWMVTNESPDGFAVMHMSGPTNRLHVGDIVALQPISEKGSAATNWSICLVRWAQSENPEHMELGLQVLAARAIAAHAVKPQDLEAGSVTALILPEAPPLRSTQAIILPSGMIDASTRKLILLLDQENVAIREIKPVSLDERTSRIEIFRFSPDETA